ncbi:hypothetical protein RRF57_002598 [Xylaria bambusicola]|uniref:Uncharacterized protein n=1 Tax=Xylaria bambusicola TaxID=326684 RepID=A0AAN7UEW0_9PEZI
MHEIEDVVGKYVDNDDGTELRDVHVGDLKFESFSTDLIAALAKQMQIILNETPELKRKSSDELERKMAVPMYSEHKVAPERTAKNPDKFMNMEPTRSLFSTPRLDADADADDESSMNVPSLGSDASNAFVLSTSKQNMSWYTHSSHALCRHRHEFHLE